MKRIWGICAAVMIFLGACAKPAPKEDALVRVGSLKGPTTMGLVSLMQKSEEGNAEGKYEFQIAVLAEEIAAKVADGSLDIALVPANLAAVLYQKTGGGITVIDINTLGVLYALTGDSGVTSIKDLAGKKVLSPGQGTTPEHVLRCLLKKNGVTDYEIEFVSEASEAAAILKKDPERIAVLPEPFASAVLLQNDAVKRVFSLSEVWDASMPDSRMVTGVTIVRKEFLAEHPEAVKTFLKEHAESVERIKADTDSAASLIVRYGIIEKEKAAQNSLPYCNLVCLTGKEMRRALEGYLEVLYGEDPKSVGGKMPAEDFYYGE
ncbi:MAG: ABC transporter substrate-binding protein [Erysipelotrichales bacterium]|nr:ABC transporter substrate-binding protein [Erysipelotrichales bacterium]